ncbi:MATE family efflux transporter [Spirochaeta thermophila]|uniref:MATE efflux family protein n=1 Tax=Winmispira thermophila (strain ATCC 49972 / DSM 6192 / RI 19.B1) TaxID=665571 RepID=E0RU55_WINT6|nr:MATE family efflux transporter [Spirochaeta thermophila]ADN02276.1 hypothetical protein STHERM_c13350 [Spirochaeta thermophila DSM 6192]
METTTVKPRLTLSGLAWPIMVETALRTTLTSVDTFMLARYADEAAAAVGMVQQFVFFVMLIYMMGATGASILVSQHLGAGDERTAAEIARTALFYNLVVGVLLSLGLRLIVDPLIASLGVDATVGGYARDYLYVYFSCSVFQAMSLLLASLVRSYGYSSIPMYVTFGANLLNVAGNYLVLFGPGGFPVLGVKGVALSTVISQAAGMVALFIVVLRRPYLDFLRGFSANWRHVRNILRIGGPSAGENLSYNLAQMALLYLITPMGTAAIASYTYTVNISRFSFIVSLSLGRASQILVGHRVGAGENDRAFREVLRTTAAAMVSSLLAMGTIALFRMPVIHLLTADEEIVRITSELLLWAVILEFGRPINLVVISALKGAGDALFPVIVGVLMMWGISVTGAWFFGIVLSWGMGGIWLGKLLDEWLRGFVMIGRWVSRRWEGRSFVETRRETA